MVEMEVYQLVILLGVWPIILMLAALVIREWFAPGGAVSKVWESKVLDLKGHLVSWCIDPVVGPNSTMGVVHVQPHTATHVHNLEKQAAEDADEITKLRDSVDLWRIGNERLSERVADLEEQLRHKYLLDGASEHVARERDRKIVGLKKERDEFLGKLDAAEKHVEILRARVADGDKIHNRRAVSLDILREQLHEIKVILDYTSIEKMNLSAEIVKLNGALLDAKKRKRKQPMCPR